MIRSVLSIFAKKTAVVAVSGVVILGGATLALAEVGDDAPDTSCDDAATTEVEECEGEGDTTSTTEVDDTTTTTEVDDTTTTTEAGDTTTTSEPDEAGEEGDDEAGELETLAEDVLEGEELEEDSHGAMVSEAARETCWEANYLDLYGNHGQCVRTFAHGEGLTAEEVDAAIAARDAEQAAQDDEPTVDTTETENEVQETESAKPGKGNGNAGGNGNGHGKGKKG